MVLSDELVLLAVTAGGYVSWWKALLLVLVILAWGRLVTWIDKDAQSVLLPRVSINLGMVLGGALGIFLFFMLPGFAIAFLVLVGVVLAELGVYLAIRAQKSGLGDIGTQFTDWLASFRGEAKGPKAVAGEINFIGKGGSFVAAPDAEAPERGGYEAAQQMLTEPLRRGAEQVDVQPVEGQSIVKYYVDGVSYNGPQIEKGRASAGVAYVKGIAGLNLEEKRKPQTGTMRVSIDGRKHELQVTTAGSTAGDQLRAIVDVKKRHDHRLETLGMPDDQIEQIREMINDSGGVVVLSAPRGHGLTSLEYAILRAHDAFLQHIQTIESEQDQDLEGITQNKVGKQPAEYQKTAEWITSQEPDVILLDKLDERDAKTALVLNKFSETTGKRVYVGLRASSTFDALAAWRQLIGDDSRAVRNLKMIVNARVMRKLCPACKAGYTPDPGTLKKLNLDPEKVGKLYQARTQPLRDPKGNPITCDFCKELMFKGRIGVYEILNVDDDVKAVVEAGGSANQLKAAFRKQRGMYLQENALLQVAIGETSIQEVLRVMRTDEDRGSSGTSGSGAKRPAPPAPQQPARKRA